MCQTKLVFFYPSLFLILVSYFSEFNHNSPTHPFPTSFFDRLRWHPACSGSTASFPIQFPAPSVLSLHYILFGTVNILHFRLSLVSFYQTFLILLLDCNPPSHLTPPPPPPHPPPPPPPQKKQRKTQFSIMVERLESGSDLSEHKM